jgi:pyridoxine kinase
LGYEVDNLNSVQFPHHSGYCIPKGQILDPETFEGIIQDMEKQAFLEEYTHILSGYIRSPLSVEKLVSLVKKLRAHNPNIVYLMDPVLGDHGRMYVDSGVLPVYQNQLLSLATIITPNQYEAQWISGLEIKSVKDAEMVLKKINEIYKIPFIVITSLDLGTNELVLIAGEFTDAPKIFTITFPKLLTLFTGTGDLFSSLLLAYVGDNGLLKACEYAVSAIYHILRNTEEHGLQRIKSKGLDPSALTFQTSRKFYELQIIANQDCIKHPIITYHASIING